VELSCVWCLLVSSLPVLFSVYLPPVSFSEGRHSEGVRFFSSTSLPGWCFPFLSIHGSTFVLFCVMFFSGLLGRVILLSSPCRFFFLLSPAFSGSSDRFRGPPFPRPPLHPSRNVEPIIFSFYLFLVSREIIQPAEKVSR